MCVHTGTSFSCRALNCWLPNMMSKRPWQREGREPGTLDGPVEVPPCKMVLTHRDKYRATDPFGQATMYVRCRCMIGTNGPAKSEFFVYDKLGAAGSITEAVAIWRGHVDDLQAMPKP